MTVVLTCPQGHQWQTETSGAAPGVPLRDACPVCGSSAQTLAGEAAPAGQRSESETLAPSPAGAAAEDAAELCRLLAPAQGPDEIGRLGGYRVLAVLGSGGMGVVLRAEDVELRRLVALKAMLPAIAASPANRERFRREAQAAAALSHDHIVPIYHVGEDRGIPFLVMPLLQGVSLNDRLQREPQLPVADVLHIGRETATGLAAAHERGLVHRDIKPANLWLETLPGEPGGSSPRYRVKILDFGLARAAAGSAQLTQTGTILGTPAFMAPEQASGKPVDGRCDLFSLGCVLYRASTGELPFRGTDAISTLMAVAMEQPPSPARLNPELPPAVSDLVMRLLAKSPADRPASARDVVRALDAVEQVPLADVAMMAIADALPAPDEPDDTAHIPEVIPVLPAKVKRDDEARRQRERDRALKWTGAIAGGLILGFVGLIVGGVIGGISTAVSGHADHVVVGLILGLVGGALTGLLAGPIAAGVYDGYVTAEREWRGHQRHR
jgi:serine/threonine protein kinase